MKGFPFVSLICLISWNADSTSGLQMIESNAYATALNFSQIHKKSLVFAEENQSVLSCGMRCNRVMQCVGFGYRKQPSSACVLVIQGVSEEPVSRDLDGFTYYHMENRGKWTLFSALILFIHA